MIARWIARVRGFSRRTRLLLLASALVGFAFQGVYSVLRSLYLLRLGHGPESIGLISSISLLLFALFCLPSGALAVRIGTRRMLMAGLGVVSLSFVVLPFLQMLPRGAPLIWTVVPFALLGLGFAPYTATSGPALMASTREGDRDRVFALSGALFPSAGVLGNLVGGFIPGLLAPVLAMSLEQPAPYGYPLWLAAAVVAVAVWTLSRTRGLGLEREERAGRTSEPVPWKPIAAMALFSLLRSAGGNTCQTFFIVYLDAALALPTSWIGVLSSLGLLVSVLGALAMPRLVARWDRGRTMVWGVLGAGISMLPLALVPHWSAAGLGYLGVQSFSAISLAAYGIHQMTLVAPRWRTLMAGATSTTMGLSWAGLSLGGGYMITSLGYRSLFLVAAGLTAIGSLVMWASLRWVRGQAP